MSLELLPFKPGFYSDDTDRGVGVLGLWKNGDKVRFFHSLPQTIGGWVNDDPNAAMQGAARGVVDWLTLRSERVIAFGTSSRLYVWIGGVFSDITPARASSTINNNPFATTNGSAVVTVTDTAHGAVDGDYVVFSGAAAVAGITIVGEYQLTYIDADSYTITHSAAANATTTGGGAAVVATYLISAGQVDSTTDYGWGAGLWGEETWGTARSTGVGTFARTWSLDTWGEDLIATHFNGNIYVWDSSSGVTSRATLITQAPTSNKSAFVAMESRHLVALGADADPLLIRWCDSEDYTDWTPTTTNTAGDARVDQGSMLMRGIKLRDQTLVYTDEALYAMQFVGPPYTFSVKPIGASGGLVSPNAAAVHAGVAYWMGNKNFYSYDGTIRPLPCPVHSTVFNDFNTSQAFKVFAMVNIRFDEIWWLYCSENSTEIDRYVALNTVDGHWIFGTIERTLMVGNSDVIGDVYGVSPDGYLFFHETGTSAAGAAIDAYIESGDVDLPKAGEYMMHISKIIPDFKRLTGEVEITVTTKSYPGNTETQSSGAITVDSSTKFINPRVRGRQASFKIESNSNTAEWRMGTLRADLRPHGKR